MRDKKIKSITIVTAQGVKIHNVSDKISITETFYRVTGDPYPCFHVIEDNHLVCEIRCVHLVELEYFKPSEQS